MLLAISNLWDNIQIIKTYILKHNPVSLKTKYLEFKTLHHNFGHTSDEVMHHVLDNVENIKKIYFPTQKMCLS